MKIRFVLCHPANALFGEEREIFLADALRRQGHDAAYFAMSLQDRRESRRHAEFSAPVEMFPRDEPAAEPHQSASAALLAALVAEAPDLILVKGVDYRLASLIFARFPRERLGVVIGGRGAHPLLDWAGLIYFETRAQEDAYAGPARTAILPKYIKWEDLDAAAEHEKRYDVINIGNFDELRKSQELLFPLAHRHSVLFVGGGARLEAFKAVAAGNRNMTFAGFVPRKRVFELLKASRLMVHASTWDGYPRAVAEALAAGVAVIGVEGVLDGITAEPFIRCVRVEELSSAAAEALRDGEALSALGQRARDYMLEHSSHAALLAAFCKPLRLADTAPPPPSPAAPEKASPPKPVAGIGVPLAEEFRRRPDLGHIMELLIARIYSRYVKSADWVVDGGADAGMHTVPLAKLAGEGGRVLAYEPRSTADLARSLAEAGVQNVIVRQAALSNAAGSASFYRNTAKLTLSSLARPADMTGYVEEQVELRRLDDEDVGGPLTFIKLDLEGAEFDCLKGAERLLDRHSPLIVFENGRETAARQFGYRKEEFFALFARHGYRIADLFGRSLDSGSWHDGSLAWYFVAAAAPDRLAEIADMAAALVREIDGKGVRFEEWRELVRAVGEFGNLPATPARGS